MKYLISRHQEGISLNPVEFLLDKESNLMQFDTITEAVVFMLKQNAQPEDFGYTYFIGTEKKHDQYTPDIYGASDQPETCRKDGRRVDILYEGEDENGQAFQLCLCPECGTLYFTVDDSDSFN